MFFIFSIPTAVVLFFLVIIAAIGFAIISNVLNILYTFCIILFVIDGLVMYLINNYKAELSKKYVLIRTAEYFIIAFILHIIRDEHFIEVNAIVLAMVVALYLSLTYIYHMICRRLDHSSNKGILVIPILILLSSVLLPIGYYVANGIERSTEKTAEISAYIVLEEAEMYGLEIEMVEVLDFKAHEKKTVLLQKPDIDLIKWHLKPGAILTYKGTTVGAYVLCKMNEQPGLQGFVPVENLNVYDTP